MERLQSKKQDSDSPPPPDMGTVNIRKTRGEGRGEAKTNRNSGENSRLHEKGPSGRYAGSCCHKPYVHTENMVMMVTDKGYCMNRNTTTVVDKWC